MAQIDRLAREQKFGKIEAVFEIHEGRVVATTGRQTLRKKHKDTNAGSIAAVAEKVKEYSQQKETGEITVTLQIKKGNITDTFIETNFRQIFI